MNQKILKKYQQYQKMKYLKTKKKEMIKKIKIKQNQQKIIWIIIKMQLKK